LAPSLDPVLRNLPPRKFKVPRRILPSARIVFALIANLIQGYFRKATRSG